MVRKRAFHRRRTTTRAKQARCTRLAVEPLEPRLVLSAADSTVVFNEIMYHPSAGSDSVEMPVRQRAAWALGKIGPLACDALDALRQAVASSNPRLAMAPFISRQMPNLTGMHQHEQRVGAKIFSSRWQIA